MVREDLKEDRTTVAEESEETTKEESRYWRFTTSQSLRSGTYRREKMEGVGYH